MGQYIVQLIVNDGSLSSEIDTITINVSQFSRDASNEIVTDHITNLVWQDNSDVTNTKPWVVQASFESKAYTDTFGNTANTYCSDLVLNSQTDWRVPTIEELSTIIDYTQEDNAIFSTFKYLATTQYWTNTSRSGFNNYAWYINFTDGSTNVAFKNVFNSLRCVRGNELSVPDYLNKSSIIIIDRTHELMWQNNYSENIAELEWQDSVDYCESLTLNTFSDWRLPTINELKTIIDYSENNPSINSLFSEISLEDYWSSTVVVGTSSNIWLVSFGAEGGKIYNQKSRSLKYIARCVRDN